MRSRRRVWVASLFVASITSGVLACVGDDPAPAATTTPQEAGSDAGTDAEDARGDGACNLLAPWLDPTPLNSVNSIANEQHPALSADELTIYFSSRRTTADADGGVSRIFTATRTSAETDSFSEPVALSTDINKPAWDNVGASLSNDRRNLYFATNAGSSGRYVVYEALRDSLSNASWSSSVLTALGDPDAGTTDFAPFLSSNGALYFGRSTTASPQFDLYRADDNGGSGFKQPVLLPELASAQDDSDPILTPDGLTVYFSSTRPGSAETDIWTAKRNTTASGFDPPTRVAELSSLNRDAPGWVSHDGCRMYLVSARPGGPGQLDIFVASKPK